ncbi:MAG TPA: Bax inhibitor-1 family protein [Candidatus Acidoferrales bacterium]|nr:Bax inhibitor-1 family protein [Candidatus Acidoferrales bacterium]
MYTQQPRPMYGGPSSVSSAALLGQVLGITAVGFLITALAAFLFAGVSYTVGLVALIGGLVLLFAINGTRANPALSLLLFYGFTFLEGIGIAPTIAYYVASVGSNVVVEAAATTGAGMLVLALAAYALSFDFRRLSGIAFGMLLGLVIIGVISMFTHFIHPSVYSWATLAVFTLLVLIDFQRIRAGGDGLTPVQLATSIYLDAINIFLALLRIFGSRGRD